jgi:hypothetical protein
MLLTPVFEHTGRLRSVQLPSVQLAGFGHTLRGRWYGKVFGEELTSFVRGLGSAMRDWLQVDSDVAMLW